MDAHLLHDALPPDQRPEPKRRKTISFAERQALRRHHAANPTQKQRELSQWFEATYGHAITQSSISDSLSDKYAFLDSAAESPQDLGRARVARSDHPLLEARLYEWQQLQQAEQLPVTGPLLKAAAERIWASLPHGPDEKDFKFSNGWLEGYKRRHGLHKKRDLDPLDPDSPTALHSSRATRRRIMSGRLHARVAVITGAASGLGRAIALTFAAEGARIVCADLRPDFAASWGGEAGATHEVLQRLHGPDSAIFVSCDVSDKVSVKGLVASTVQWAGRLDIMINNAGISAEGVHEQPLRVHETPLSTFDRTMAINVRGVFIGCKYALAQMMEQEPLPPNDRGDRTRGWIVNMASILGTVAIAAASSYTASKHAVIGLTKQVAVEYAKDRIHCNAMCPGFVETALTKRVLASEMLGPMLTAAHPWGTLGKPNDIAKAVLFLASDDASWVTGHSLLVDGGYTAQ